MYLLLINKDISQNMFNLKLVIHREIRSPLNCHHQNICFKRKLREYWFLTMIYFGRLNLLCLPDHISKLSKNWRFLYYTLWCH